MALEHHINTNSPHKYKPKTLGSISQASSKALVDKTKQVLATWGQPRIQDKYQWSPMRQSPEKRRCMALTAKTQNDRKACYKQLIKRELTGSREN
eukprot:1105589-Amphidinium_carterae.1